MESGVPTIWIERVHPRNDIAALLAYSVPSALVAVSAGDHASVHASPYFGTILGRL
jgi:hypothetical protein